MNCVDCVTAVMGTLTLRLCACLGRGITVVALCGNNDDVSALHCYVLFNAGPF